VAVMSVEDGKCFGPVPLISSSGFGQGSNEHGGWSTCVPGMAIIPPAPRELKYINRVGRDMIWSRPMGGHRSDGWHTLEVVEG